jgi:hypothetical protein
MTYNKPQLTHLSLAIDAIHGTGKSASVEDAEHREATCAAYEADE